MSDWWEYSKFVGTDGYESFSSRLLELALEQGFTVYVISTYDLGPCDDWWRSLIPAENVFLGNYSKGGTTDPNLIKAWRELYARLNLPLPRHETWMELEEGLKPHGIKLGWDFQRPTLKDTHG